MAHVSNAIVSCQSVQICYQSSMNFRHLRAFATIVDAGSFARAAERLHVSPPALSRQIHAFELELGISLFDRVGRGVRLTSQGEDLLRHGRRLLTDVGSFSERARALKAGQAGLLRVGATPQVIENLLADFLAGHERRHPLVEVELKEAGGAQLGDLLDRGEIEVVIMPSGDARFEERALYPMSLVAVLPEGHRLSRCRSLEITELESEPLFLLSRGFASRAWFEAACQIAHVRGRVVLESRAPKLSLLWRGPGAELPLFPHLCEYLTPASASRRSCTAVLLLADGPLQLGTRADFSLPTPNYSSENLPPPRDVTTLGVFSSVAHHPCRNRGSGNPDRPAAAHRSQFSQRLLQSVWG